MDTPYSTHLISGSFRLKKVLKNHWSYLTQTGSVPGLDTLRAAAVFGVISYHFNLPFMRFGWIGVDLFFVLSGFLVGGGLIEKVESGALSLGKFYKQRALRILPIYFLVVSLVFFLKAHDWSLVTVSLVAALSFTYMFLSYTGLAVLDWSYVPGGAWTLAIENWFYAIAPLFFLSIKWLSPTRRFVLLVAIFFSGPLVRILTTTNFAPNDSNWYFANVLQFHSRFDELVMGVLVFLVAREIPNLRVIHRMSLVLGSVLVLIFSLWLNASPYWETPQVMTRDTIVFPTYLSLAFGLIVFSGSQWKLNLKPITVLARLSYPLYLLHILIREIYLQHLSEMPQVLQHLDQHLQAALLIAVSLLAAYLASLLVEYPFMKRRNVST